MDPRIDKYAYCCKPCCIDTASTLGMCAERNAIANMITNGESQIDKVVAVMPDGKVGSPCGACREYMMQLDKDSGDIEILLDLETKKTVRLKERSFRIGGAQTDSPSRKSPGLPGLAGRGRFVMGVTSFAGRSPFRGYWECRRSFLWTGWRRWQRSCRCASSAPRSTCLGQPLVPESG